MNSLEAPSGPTPTKTELIMGLQAIKKEDWDYFVRSRTPGLHRMIRSRNIPSFAVQNVTQEVFYKLFKKLTERNSEGQLIWVYNRARGRLTGYLCRIVQRCCTDWHRARRNTITCDPMILQDSDKLVIQEWTVMDGVTRQAMGLALAALAENHGGKKEYEIWRAKHFENCGTSELCQRFETTAGAVFTACYKFNKLFKDEFERNL
jgi:DNA-directed RNA polymerase specialized sigma24 family protein